MSIKTIIKELEEKWGDGAIRMGDNDKIDKIEVIPTPSVSLNNALGIQGIPLGRIIELYGNFSSGKSTLALHLVAEAQKMGKKCVYIDIEHCFDSKYAKSLGVNLNELFISQAGSAEEAMDIIETFIKEGDIGLIVIDSVAAMTVQAEIDGSMGQSHIGLLARLMGQALRKITSLKTEAAIIFINQIRDNINVFYGGEQTTTPGGQALKFFSSVRIEMRRSAKLTKGENIVGNRTKVKITKNKLASPFKTCEFDIIFGKGIDRESDMIAFSLEKGILKKDGNSIFFGDLKLGGKLETARKYLEENVEVFNKINETIKTKMNDF
jgi:recombination protein RecA